jgi:hypothetical protein
MTALEQSNFASALMTARAPRVASAFKHLASLQRSSTSPHFSLHDSTRASGSASASASASIAALELLEQYGFASVFMAALE